MERAEVVAGLTDELVSAVAILDVVVPVAAAEHIITAIAAGDTSPPCLVLELVERLRPGQDLPVDAIR